MKHWATILIAAMMLSPVGSVSVQAKSKIYGCPPGLAKKNPPCVPPGQAKKRYKSDDHDDDDDDDYHHDHSDGHHYHRGDYYDYDDYPDDRLSDYDRRRLGLPRLGLGQNYYRLGDGFIRVDTKTRAVLDLIDALGRVLN